MSNTKEDTMGDEKKTEALTKRHMKRWARMLDRLAEGPQKYGPHDAEEVCAALERVLDKRDALAKEVDHLREQSHAEHLFNCEIREAMGFYSDAVTDEQVIEAVRKMRKAAK